jgi:hypothetical protein
MVENGPLMWADVNQPADFRAKWPTMVISGKGDVRHICSPEPGRADISGTTADA